MLIRFFIKYILNCIINYSCGCVIKKRWFKNANLKCYMFGNQVENYLVWLYPDKTT